MASRKKTAVLALLAAAAVLLGGLLATPGGRAVCQALKWSAIRQLRAYTFNSRIKFFHYDNSVVALFRKWKESAPDNVIPAVRAFIFEHSVREFVAEYNDDIEKMYGLAEKALQDNSTRMPMKCDARAHLMRNILYNIGISSRLVHGLGLDEQGGIIGHTFLEAYDDAKNLWVVQDPYFNLSFIHTRTGRPANLVELCMYPIKDFMPSPDSAPEEFAGKDDFFGDIYSIIVYDNRLAGDVNIVFLNKEKLGVRSVKEFQSKQEFAALRSYLTANWNDYRLVDL